MYYRTDFFGVEMDINHYIDELNNPDQYKRMQAAEYLSKSNSKEIINPLLECLEDESPEVRYSVVKALGQFPDYNISNSLLNLLKDPAWFVRVKTAIVLEKNLKDSAQSILEFLQKNDPHVFSRLHSAFALIILNRDTEKNFLKFIIEHLNDDDIAIQKQALALIGDLNDESVIESLFDCFYDSNDEVQALIIKILYKYQNETVDNWFIEQLTNKDPNIRCAILKVMDKSESSRLLEPIISALDDEDDYVQCCAAIALGNIGDEKAIEPLLQKLVSDNKDLVFYAKEALNKINF